MKKGEGKIFDRNWIKRDESYYTHWTRGDVRNQIQLAFRSHYTLFRELMRNKNFNNGKKVLEVGCGRGSISCYFADSGYKCTLLDISPKAIEVAKEIYKRNKLKAEFIVGDALDLPFESGSFDVVVSIGLLEHFQKIDKLLSEQIRILRKGGIFLGYVVPKYKENVQKDFVWINEVLKGYVDSADFSQKEIMYRSDDDSTKYVDYLKKYGLKGVKADGVYPLPMISHSVEFPFSLMPEKSELSLTEYFQKLLRERKKKFKRNPWLCKEGYGQAFLVWGYRK
jgi:ubiquinone/menaquinone biosynthesis C-methylase UbiE